MKIKYINSIILLSILSFSGCSHDPKIAKQQNINQIEENIDYRVNEFNKRHYQNNFNTVEIADSEREIGIKTLNKSTYRTYNQNRIKRDDLDITPKTKIKVITRSDIKIIKKSDGTKRKTKMTQVETIQVLSKNNIHDSIDYETKYKKVYPFVFGINKSIFKRDLKTNVEYVMAIDNKQRIGIYQKSNKCNKKVMKNSNYSCYLDIRNYKYSPNFKKHTTIHFEFNGKNLKVFNQKFKLSKKVGEKLEIKFTKNKTLYMKINK